MGGPARDTIQKIRMMEFIDAIPKSSTGKILRKELQNLPVAEAER